MKPIFILLLTTLSLNSFADCQFTRSLFIAQVKNLTDGGGTTCAFNLNFGIEKGQLNPEEECGLDVDDIGDEVLAEKINGLCPVSNGEVISGSLISFIGRGDNRVFYQP